MDYENRFEKILGSVSKDKFRQYANKLLNECFILKECTDTKNCYYFILIPQNSKRFSDSEESTNPAVRVTERKL